MRIKIFLLLTITLTTCSTANGKKSESVESVNENSYEATVMINGMIFSTSGVLNNDNQYTPQEKI